MGMFSGIEKVKPSANGGSYVKPGHYFLRIDRVKAGDSQQGSGAFVAIEMTVLGVFPDGDPVLDEGFNIVPDSWHRPGETVTHLMMQKHASFQANYKAFVANVGGIPEEKVSETHCVQVTEGLFEGLIVEVRARTIKTRKGSPFTVVGYSREVPPSEVKSRVDVDALTKVLGPGKIDELIEAFGE